jgi:hypothetical protein
MAENHDLLDHKAAEMAAVGMPMRAAPPGSERPGRHFDHDLLAEGAVVPRIAGLSGKVGARVVVMTEATTLSTEAPKGGTFIMVAASRRPAIVSEARRLTD